MSTTLLFWTSRTFHLRVVIQRERHQFCSAGHRLGEQGWSAPRGCGGSVPSCGVGHLDLDQTGINLISNKNSPVAATRCVYAAQIRPLFRKVFVEPAQICVRHRQGRCQERRIDGYGGKSTDGLPHNIAS